MHRSFTRNLKIFCLLASGFIFHSNSWAIGPCPAVGYATSCSALITINPNGSLKVQIDPSVTPYDGSDDTLVGVINHSGATVYGIQLTGSNIFGLDGDGAFGGGNYSGPNTNFIISADGNSGVVNFNAGLADGQFVYFSLEGAPSQVKLAKRITIDPGHGLSCPTIHEKLGAFGDKIYPANNPPAGRLREDYLTVDVAQKLQPLLANDGYAVFLTKNNVNQCLPLIDRAKYANVHRSNMFVAIHFDAPAGITRYLGNHGSEGIYNSTKSDSYNFANFVAQSTSSALGVSNRGTKVDNDLGVLKLTSSRMTSILIEVARLSSPDDDIIHAAGATGKAANGIRNGINQFVNQ